MNDRQQQLQQALAAKGESYQPRTRHLNSDGSPVYINRLILEDSPYLLQHAHNPVDWYAWNRQAFEAAKTADKPIFLSIGYSTCHWCHVMEHESFEDEKIAEYLNQHFISIKVDRENRPDLDVTYMTAVTLLTGQGGWPMSSFLTEQGQPFFGGTYYNPEEFLTLLEQIVPLWNDRRDDMMLHAAQVTAAVKDYDSATHEAAKITSSTLNQTLKTLLKRYDSNFGGFSGTPKFPLEPTLLFLLDVLRRKPNDALLKALDHTLQNMAQGGIYDQIGGGFHRYATDAGWLVPHFEKMLYNQALLAQVYCQAYQLTGKSFYARILHQTLDYVLTDMSNPDGAFFAATDADSDGAEGSFFVWTPAQIEQVLGKTLANFACDVYGVTQQGNFEGRNILNLPQPLSKFATQRALDFADVLKTLELIKTKLYQARTQRIPPLRDDKIITAWNGMMIKAFAMASAIPGNAHYLDAAINAADFIWHHNRQDNGQLWRCHLNGHSSVTASQEDYAFYADALLSLYDRSEDPIWLDRAEQLSNTMLALFWDDQAGGFFMNAADLEVTPVARPKESHDGAIPAGNAVAMEVLTQLARRTGTPLWREKAKATLTCFSGAIAKQPEGYTALLRSISQLQNGEMSNIAYHNGGAIRAQATLELGVQQTLLLRICLTLKTGWYIQTPSHSSLQLTCSAPSKSVKFLDIRYPPASESRTSQTLTIKARLHIEQDHEPMPDQLLRLALKIQACNNQACFPEETLRLCVSFGELLPLKFD